MAVMLQYFCTRTTQQQQQHEWPSKTNFMVLASFTTVHMHLYLNALTAPPQCSHNPTIKIKNLPNHALAIFLNMLMTAVPHWRLHPVWMGITSIPAAYVNMNGKPQYGNMFNACVLCLGVCVCVCVIVCISLIIYYECRNPTASEIIRWRAKSENQN